MKFKLNFLQDWSNETLISVKNLTFLIIIADMFGVYWYLEWKQLAGAILIVCVGFLAFVLHALGQRNEKGGGNMGKKEDIEDLEKELKVKKLEKEIEDIRGEDKDSEEESDSGFGLPSAEEYNKRLDKMVG